MRYIEKNNRCFSLNRESRENRERARRCNRGRKLLNKRHYLGKPEWEGAANLVDPRVRRPAWPNTGIFRGQENILKDLEERKGTPRIDIFSIGLGFFIWGR